MGGGSARADAGGYRKRVAAAVGDGGLCGERRSDRGFGAMARIDIDTEKISIAAEVNDSGMISHTLFHYVPKSSRAEIKIKLNSRFVSIVCVYV